MTKEENHNNIDNYIDNDNENIFRYTLAKLSDKEKKAGVIAASAGNHAQVSWKKKDARTKPKIFQAHHHLGPSPPMLVSERHPWKFL